MMAWLSVWSEVQMICIWFSWCHCHPIILASAKFRMVYPSVPAYPGCLAYNNLSHLSHTQSFIGRFSRTARIGWYQKDRTILDFLKQWHQLDHMHVICASLQTVTPAPHHLSYLRAACSSCHPTNSIKALKADVTVYRNGIYPEGCVLE